MRRAGGPLSAPLIFLAAAVLEIAGCFAFWTVLRQGASILWLGPGVACLVGFAWLLTLFPSDVAAGRAYAAYGGIYIAATLGWLMLVEGVRPTGWDLAGAALCLAGTGVILMGAAQQV